MSGLRMSSFTFVLLVFVWSSLTAPAPAPDCPNTVFNVFTSDKKAGGRRGSSDDSTNDQSDKQQVVFSVASRNADLGTAAYTPVKFDEVLTNRQNAFNLATNVFTAPVAGVYAFSFTGRASGNNVYVYFNLNGQRRFLTVMSPTSSAGSFSTVVEMHAGDVAFMALHPSHKLLACSSPYPPCSTFSGYLIHTLSTELKRQ